MANEQVQEGLEVFVSDDDKAFGAVRDVRPHGRAELIVYVENAGDFTIPLPQSQPFIPRRSSSTAPSSITSCARPSAMRTTRRIRRARPVRHAGPGCPHMSRVARLTRSR
jgi:hypothetical protein